MAYVFPPTELYGFQPVACNSVKLENIRNDLFLFGYN